MRVAAPLDIAGDVSVDLSRRSVVDEVIAWIDSGLLWGIWLAVPCTFDSIASGHVQRSAEELAKRERLVANALRLEGNRVGGGLCINI